MDYERAILLLLSIDKDSEAYKQDCWNIPLNRVARCPLFRGSLCIAVYGETIGTIRSVHYIVCVCYSRASAKRGSTVHHWICCMDDQKLRLM